MNGAQKRNSQAKISQDDIKNIPAIPSVINKKLRNNVNYPPIQTAKRNQFLKQQHTESSSLFWLYVTILLIVLFGIVFTYHDVFFKKLDNLRSGHSSSSAFSLPLNVKNVHWDKVIKPDGSLKIAVVGEVMNQNKIESRLRPVHIRVWGPCNISDPSSKTCMHNGYVHHFQQSIILPNENVSFVASWMLPKGTTISHVDVVLQ